MEDKARFQRRLHVAHFARGKLAHDRILLQADGDDMLPRDNDAHRKRRKKPAAVFLFLRIRHVDDEKRLILFHLDARRLLVVERRAQKIVVDTCYRRDRTQLLVRRRDQIDPRAGLGAVDPGKGVAHRLVECQHFCTPFSGAECSAPRFDSIL